MRKIKYALYGILTFVLGLIVVGVITGANSHSDGLQVTTGIFNSGIIALSTSIIFLSATITTCTVLIISTIKKNYK